MGTKPHGQVTVRLATVDDYERVLDIDRNLYDGEDYLPYKYHKFLRDPNRSVFIGEIDGKAVSELNTLNLSSL